MMKLTIDGSEVEAAEGTSVLDAALDAGIFIPHLCKHPDLEAVGGCRLCAVEVNGSGHAVPACKTQVEEGMVVDSHAASADHVRRMAMELILATHPSDCTGCPKYGVCELQSMYQYLGVSPARWRCRARTVPTDDSNPLITHMFTRCVRCGRCVRACRELRGVGVLDYQRTEDGVRIGIDGGVSLEEAGCRFCGACVEVCPTGSIVDVLGLNKPERSREDNVVPCRSGCPAHIDIPRYLRHVKAGEWEKATAVVREKVPFPETLGSICTHNCRGSASATSWRVPALHLQAQASCRRARHGRVEVPRAPRAAYGQARGHRGRRPRWPHRGVLPGREGPCGHGLQAEERPAASFATTSAYLPDEEFSVVSLTILRVAQGTDEARIEELRCGGACTSAFLAGIRRGAGDRGHLRRHSAVHEATTVPASSTSTDFLKAARKGNPIEVNGRVVVLGGGNVATLPTTAPAPPCAWVPRAWTLLPRGRGCRHDFLPRARGSGRGGRGPATPTPSRPSTSLRRLRQVGSITIDKIAKFC